MRIERVEPRHTFSIYLPTSLYQKLVDKAGRGRVSTFIKQVLEKELEEETNCLGNAYKECYTNNPHLLEEAKLWERAEIEDWLTYEKNKNATKKPRVKK